MTYVPCMPASSTCPCANLPNECQLLIITCKRANNVPTSQRCDNYSTLACQCAKGVSIFQLRLPKGIPIFQLFLKRTFQFLNFSIMLTIYKFQKYLSNSRKLISRNKEFKFWHFRPGQIVYINIKISQQRWCS